MTVPPPSCHPRALRWSAVRSAVLMIGAALLLATLLTGRAEAHGGPVELQVVTVDPAPGEVRVVVRLVYTTDGHGVADAAVTVAGESGGVRLTPAALAPTPEEGVYEGVVAVPTAGVWSMRATSAEPTASQPFTVEVPAPAAAAPPTTPSAAAGSSATSTAPAGEGGGAVSATSTPSGAPGSEDDRTWVWVAAAGPVVAVVVAAAGVLYTVRRRRARSGASG